MRKQSGIALITTLLLLLLMSAMVVGFMLLVTEGQRLSGMDSDQLRAFYGAESGMEKLTADLGTLFGTTYAPAGTQVDALMTTPPNLPSSTGVSYVDSQGNPTYSITYPKDVNGNPQPNFAQITSGSSAFQGMSALETTYTLTVGALTNTGGAVKLTRTTQTVGIPLFQFGIFSDTDLSFFPGPNFDFGGRVHTNGNLFLNSGGPAGATPTQAYPPTVQLWMRSPVTASKDIMRDCLSNTNPESTSGRHPGSVEITKGGGTMQALGFGQGSLNNCLGSGANPNWPTISGSFNGNLRSGVRPLNLTIALLGNGISTPIDMIRRPVAGELATNPGVLGERYFSEASLRVLLSDNATDITSLPCVSPGAPFNLADLALPVASWTTANATALQAAMTAAGTIPVPLAASGAATNAVSYATAAVGGDGYWQFGQITTPVAKLATPIITGYIKIDEQTAYGSPCGTYKDVTQEILSLGYAGRNINPVSLAPPQLPGLPGALVPPSGCPDPHPNAVIRLERVRDNPSTFATNGGCGVGVGVVPPNPSDYWPNALFDSREGYNRQPTPGPANQVSLGGIMNYIELDVKNLAKWFNGTLPATGSTGPNTRDPIVAPNNFVVYISDRRGNYLPTGTVLGVTPALSPSGHETGEYGYNDVVNRQSPNGCPDGVLEPAGASGISAEDLDGTGVLSTYGENTFPNGLINSTGVATAATLFPNALTATTGDPGCPTGSGGISPWPRTFLVNANEGRENPNALFRRAVKIMDGNLLSMPNCPGAIPCGLSIATENPAYIQGDYNANSAGGGFADPSVAASIDADAVTILSANWNDVNSFASPFNVAFGRTGTTTYVRAGIMAGKQIAFNIPNWDTTAIDGSRDFGTDGGVHNFLRFLEKWNGTLFYEGSIVSMYYSRQATGLFNSGGNNYSPPTRGYSFDVNFLNPTLLPPRTPMFRDVNTTGFTQLMLPNQ